MRFDGTIYTHNASVGGIPAAGLVRNGPPSLPIPVGARAARVASRRRARILRDARDRMRARNYARGRVSESDGFVQRASVAGDRQEAIGNGTTYVRRGRPRIPDLPRLTGMGL